MATFLLVGCTSSVGKILVSGLIENGHKVYGIRYKSICRISHPMHSCEPIDVLSSSLSEVFQRLKPENLILASWITTPGIYMTSEDNFLWLNSYSRVLDSFKISGGICVIGLGSCAEYQLPRSCKILETDLTLPDSVYGKAKLSLLNLIRDSGLDYIWTRTFFQYGVDDPSSKFIKSAIVTIGNSGEFEVLDPFGERDYVYSGDVARVLQLLIEKEARGVFNLGTSQPFSNLQVAQIIQEKLGYTGQVRINNNAPQETLICSSNAKVSNVVGFNDWKTLQDGISLIIKSLRF